MNTIDLLQYTIKKNKMTLDILYAKLINVIDIQEKNEYINLIENLQDNNRDYEATLNILSSLDD